ncbi:olfactory receptor 6Y1-like [Pelobates fuscus]|uniref:olfactory receptor 6Y1-like n=1 Tax=Pelobates fuscus TaxID=191477 RepID=UPI002FE48F4C
MENGSLITVNIILIGLEEMQRFKYLYAVISFGVYVANILFGFILVFIIWTEPTLHEPMYIFICNVIINGMFGSTIFLPKLTIDMLSGYTTISIHGCLIQAFFINSLTCAEMLLFAVMAYDRYLAVGHPLRYPTYMTNGKALTCLTGIWIFSFTIEVAIVVLAARLTLCNMNMNNVYCEVMSFLKLACGSTALNDIVGSTLAVVVIIFTNVVAIYSYIRTFIICLKIAKDECQKAIHTLITHLMAFSLFMFGALFVLLRHRLNFGAVSPNVHLILPILGFTIIITMNPVIYGLRTKALKNKLVHYIHRKTHPRDLSMQD